MKTVVAIILCAAVGIAALAGGLCYIEKLQLELRLAEKKIVTLQEEQALARKAEARAMAARQVENEKAKQREQLMENVLCNNSDWRDIMVPDDVSRMLQQGYALDSCLPATGNTSR